MSLADKSILAVDDEEVMLKMYREFFAQKGASLRIASSAQATQEALAEQPADILIMDLKIGADNGRDLLVSLRRAYPSMRCIFVTAYATDPAVKELLALGVDEVIQKPCTIRTIYESVEKVALASRKLTPDRVELESGR